MYYIYANKIYIFRTFKSFFLSTDKKEATYSRPIAKARIMSGKRSLYHNDVTENTSETMNTNSACYCSDIEHENRFISEILSVIGYHVVAFINKIITLNRKLLYSLNAMLRKCLNIYVFGINALILYHYRLKDYDPLANIFYLGSNQRGSKTHSDTNSVRVSKGEECIKIHKMRHSIIEDKTNDTKYLLIDTSTHNCHLISKYNLGQPYGTRRNLLIRSRLKTHLNSQDCQKERPVSLLKRVGKKLGPHLRERNENTVARRETYKLNGSEKFWALPEIIRASKKNSETSEVRLHDDEFKEQIAHEYSRDDIANNVMREYAIIDNTSASNELVINVHDYLGLRTEINTNVMFTKPVTPVAPVY